jgi:hypothetical protein
MTSNSETVFLPVPVKNTEKKGSHSSMAFFVSACLWSFLTFGLAWKFATYNVWIVVAGVLIFSVPIFLCGFYSATIYKIRRLNMFQSKGFLHRLFSRRALMWIFWVLWAMFSSFFMLIQFHTYDPFEWAIYFLVIPVFWLVFIGARRIYAKELKPYLVTHSSLQLARKICPIVMLLIYVLAHILLNHFTIYPTLESAVAVEKSKVADMTGSALVMETSQFLAFYAGIKAYVLGKIAVLEPTWQMLFLCLGNLVIFYNACCILSCFLIPRIEYRRILAPLTEDVIPAKPSVVRIVIAFAVFSFIAGFIFLPGVASLEIYMRQTPEFKEFREHVEKQTLVKVELIDNHFFREGTLQELDMAKLQSLKEIEIAYIRVENQLDRGFDKLEDNVDEFLDWYYSLFGEYTRLAKLLVGDLETYMEDKMVEYFEKGDVFEPFQAELNTLLTKSSEIQKVYQEKARRIMDQNRLYTDNADVEIVHRISLSEVMNPSFHNDVISLEHRLLASSGGGAVGGVVTALVVKKIIAKIIAKNTVKTAAKAIVKVIGSKLATGGAGAAAGAAAGSILPGIGTVVGAGAGIVIATVAGLSIDKLLIELEETLSRETFKAEIMTNVNRTREEMKSYFKIPAY